MRSTAAFAAVTVAVLLLGCGAPQGSADAGLGPDAGAIALSDFSLPDVNAASPTGGQNVSPRDFQGRVSAWYFGHSS